MILRGGGPSRPLSDDVQVHGTFVTPIYQATPQTLYHGRRDTLETLRTPPLVHINVTSQRRTYVQSIIRDPLSICLLPLPSSPLPISKSQNPLFDGKTQFYMLWINSLPLKTLYFDLRHLWNMLHLPPLSPPIYLSLYSPSNCCIASPLSISVTWCPLTSKTLSLHSPHPSLSLSILYLSLDLSIFLSLSISLGILRRNCGVAEASWGRHGAEVGGVDVS